MNENNRQEGFNDHLDAMSGYNRAKASEYRVSLMSNNSSVLRLATMGLVSSGYPDIAISSDNLPAAKEAAEKGMALVDEIVIPTFKSGFNGLMSLFNCNHTAAIFDLTDKTFDNALPDNYEGRFICLAHCTNKDGQECVKIGTDPDKVAEGRSHDSSRLDGRAETMGQVAHALAFLIAETGVAPYEKAPAMVKFPILPIPSYMGTHLASCYRISLLVAGCGGVSSMALIAQAEDDYLRKYISDQTKLILVDPKISHLRALNRQWLLLNQMNSPKVMVFADAIQKMFPGTITQSFYEKLCERHFKEFQIQEVLGSVDNNSARKMIAANLNGGRWWSTGVSEHSGYVRLITANSFCTPAEDGVEQLRTRSDDDYTTVESVCSSSVVPISQSTIVHMMIGSFLATQKRNLLTECVADQIELARGIQIHLTYGNAGLRVSPGRKINIRTGGRE